MVKLIASDLDGTLLQNGAHDVNPIVFDQIRILKEHGILFAAASGRQYLNLRRLFTPIQNDIAYIAENGSLCIYNEETISKGIIEQDLAYRILDEVVPHLPTNKPTYLMGVGTPANILEAVDRGVDFFDCVYPSRNGRHGHVYTNHGKMNLFNAKYELDDRPIEEGCGCPACRSYSRAYIRHLLKAKEMLGMRLCVLHNLYFYNTMMEEIRDAIDAGEYKAYKKRKLEGMEQK